MLNILAISDASRWDNLKLPVKATWWTSTLFSPLRSNTEVFVVSNMFHETGYNFSVKLIISCKPRLLFHEHASLHGDGLNQLIKLKVGPINQSDNQLLNVWSNLVHCISRTVTWTINIFTILFLSYKSFRRCRLLVIYKDIHQQNLEK